MGALDDDEKRAIKLTAGSQPQAAAAKPDANTFFLAPESSGKPNDSDRGEELRRLPGGARGKDGESEATIGVIQSEAKSADDRFAGEIGGRHKGSLVHGWRLLGCQENRRAPGGAGGGEECGAADPRHAGGNQTG